MTQWACIQCKTLLGPTNGPRREHPYVECLQAQLDNEHERSDRIERRQRMLARYMIHVLRGLALEFNAPASLEAAERIRKEWEGEL